MSEILHSSRYDTFFKINSNDIFLISPQKHMLWDSLEAPRRGASNEYPQHMFLRRNKKNIRWLTPLIWNYGFCICTPDKLYIGHNYIKHFTFSLGNHILGY